jgi:hypothetical protein
MSDLFTWLQNYLNLSKLTAVTVPGMIVAFALILVAGPIPCSDEKGCPFCSASLKAVDQKASSTDSGKFGGSDDKGLPQSPISDLAWVLVSKATWAGNRAATSAEDTIDSAVKVTPGDNTKPPNVTQSCSPLPLFGFPYSSRIFDGPDAPKNLALAQADAGEHGNVYVRVGDVKKRLSTCSNALTAAGKLLPKASSKTSSTQSTNSNATDIKEAQSSISTLNAKVSEIQAAVTAADPTTGNVPWVRVVKGTWGELKTAMAVDDQVPKISEAEPADATRPDSKHLEPPQLATIGSACDGVPRAVAGSQIYLPVNGFGDDFNKEQQKAKQKGQELQPLRTLLPTLAYCNNQLQRVSSSLATAQSTLQNSITQYNTDLIALSSNLITAKQSGEVLLERGIQAKIDDETRKFTEAERLQQSLKNATNALGVLQTSLTGMLNPLNTLPPDTAPQTNVAVDVFLAIQQNLIKFLLFSLILGQILDPIQRGAVSFFGPRRDFFNAFNQVYGQDGDGEFRYGDRRLMPWVRASGAIAETPSANDVNLYTDQISAQLRPNPAGRSFLKDRNVYDKNYAIGAGYITQNEAKSIEDEYYGQSQITSGLILPVLIFSVCLAIRIICCSSAAAADYISSSLIVLAGIPFGIIAGALLMLGALWLSSAKYSQLVSETRSAFMAWSPDEPESDKRATEAAARASQAQKDTNEAESRAQEAVAMVVEARQTGAARLAEHALLTREADELSRRAEELQKVSKGAIVAAAAARKDHEEKLRRRRKGRFRTWFLLILCLVLLLLGVAALVIASSGKAPLSFSGLGMIILPTLLVGPLWIAGLDRLHKFYSELQSRIAGNILKLQTTSQQKILDLISDPNAAAALKKKAKDAKEGQTQLVAFLESIAAADPSPGKPTSPGGSSDTQVNE